MTLLIPVAHAANLLQPGDPHIRNDIELLADAGVLHAPVTSWPLPWAGIAADLEHANVDTLTPLQYRAYSRLTALLHMERRVPGAQFKAAVKARGGESVLRWYRNEPRARGALTVGADNGTGNTLNYNLQLTAALDPDDNRHNFRTDGSYVGLRAGNWLINAGWINRWWGPAWSGSLILGTNARPVPGIAIGRVSAEPFQLPVLDWLGPWRLTFFVDRLNNDRAIPHPWFFGGRFTFRPLTGLTFGISRTVQWCGEGRPCDWVHFRQMVTGTSYRNTGVPGNSLASFDVRAQFDLGAQPFAVYMQEAGEDIGKLRHLPKKFMGLFGLETWGAMGAGSYRLFAEYADTRPDVLSLADTTGNTWNYAYENYQYRSGYRYYSQVIGYPTDNDSRLITLGAIFMDGANHTWTVLLRGGVINRDDRNAPPPGGNSVSLRKTDIVDAALSWSTRLPRELGKLTLGAGIARWSPINADTEYDKRVSLSWMRGFQ
ncbi:MAG TPA: capsule assembly Wzi family protein [Gammaproteobacteria bacterium]|nr:capsule assembly Wzi family protein [Gammaproteobacteria bacterium]